MRAATMKERPSFPLMRQTDVQSIYHTLIEKILVHEAVKDADGNRTQEIEIIYRFVGKID